MAWFRGGSEFGPRALAHRSISANPKHKKVKNFINARIKGREGFRPLAPSVLEEEVLNWFGSQGSRFMLEVATALDQCRLEAPAILHVDGSARLQRVPPSDGPFRQLLELFYQYTGLPMILNTSFNGRGEPIVEGPNDAMDLFLRTPIDVLVLDTVIVEKVPLVESLIKTADMEIAGIHNWASLGNLDPQLAIALCETAAHGPKTRRQIANSLCSKWREWAKEYLNILKKLDELWSSGAHQMMLHIRL